MSRSTKSANTLEKQLNQFSDTIRYDTFGRSSRFPHAPHRFEYGFALEIA
jgi:hypothetical protein